MVNSRQKGNRGERKVMQFFRNWWGGDWERRSMGYEGSDLITPDNFPFAVEVKDCEQLVTRHFFYPTKFLLACWQQAKVQAFDQGKAPLLVANVESKWYCVQPLSMSMSSVGSVLTRKLGDDQVEIMSIDDWMLNFEDANPSYFRKPQLTVKTRSKKTA